MSNPTDDVTEVAEKSHNPAPADDENKKPLGYLGGDIMTHGSNLAREEEYEKFKKKFGF